MASTRVQIPLGLALLALLAGCGGSGDKAAFTTPASGGYGSKAEVKSLPQNAARQALWQSYGLAKDYAAAHQGFGDPKTLAPQIGASAGNPAKREPGAIYVAATSGQSLQLVTEALDGTLVTLTIASNADPAFNIGGACDASGCRD